MDVTGGNDMGDTDSLHPRDRISKLPDFIVHHIMSYLSAEEVARTSVLSKRWNYLRTSFPRLDFVESYPHFVGQHFATFNPSLLSRRQQEQFHRRIYGFMKYVDDSLRRFCKLKLSMQKFRVLIGILNVGFCFPFDVWIGFAVEHQVKELDFDVQTNMENLYTLPQVIYSEKRVTTLKLCGCELMPPSDTIRLHSLRILTLVEVCVSGETIQKLASECMLLEELSILDCHGMKCIHISKAYKLKVIDMDVSPCVFESIGINNVPSLEQLRVGSYTLQQPIVIDDHECPNLKMLQLSGINLNDQEFGCLISKCPRLENLNLICCHCLESVTISSGRLKELSMYKCSKLKAIDANTPNLVFLSFLNNPIPVASMNAPCLRKVEVGEGEPDTRWYINVKEFLGAFDHSEDVTLCFMLKRISFNVEEFRNSSISVPREIGNLCLPKIELPSSLSTFLDGIFGICYPRTLSMESCSGIDKLIIEALYVKIMDRNNVNCCHSQRIKCWRHHLNDIQIENFLTFKDKKLLSGYDVDTEKLLNI